VTGTGPIPQIGEVIGDKYRVERVLGQGGMGAVFEATHRITGKRFAIKWMLPNVSRHEETVKRFVREAQVAGRFQHPNVVEVYDIGQHGEASFYMVMELLEGESLDVRLEREGRLPLEVACRILLPCMRGVARAHAAGIIHRDLKPANIFLCRATAETPERPKVLDFGISKATGGDLDASATTKAGAIIGTPHYMSPEGLRGEGGDHRTDIYAFGVILYELVAGKRPFDATSYIDLALKIATDTPEPLVKLVPGTPHGFARVVGRAMARDALQRYATVDELVQALEPYAAGLRPPDASVMSEPWPVASGSAVPLETPLSTESRPTYPPAGMRPPRSRMWTVIAVLAAVAALVWIARALLPGSVPTASPAGEGSAGGPSPPPARAAASAAPAPTTHTEGSRAPADAPQPAGPQPTGDGWVVPKAVVAKEPPPAETAPADPPHSRARVGSDREQEARSRRSLRRRRDAGGVEAVDPPAPPASHTAPRKSAGRLGVSLDEAEF
jgi:serine/threonine-protein kinase